MLTLDLPGLPVEIAMDADTYTLAIVAAVWLDTDDRIGFTGAADGDFI